MKKIITNTGGGSIEAHWSHFDVSGNFLRARILRIDPYALNFEVDFIDDMDFKCFSEQTGLFESGALILGKSNDKEADKKSEETINKGSKKLQNNAKKSEINPKNHIGDLGQGAELNVGLKVNGEEQGD